MSPPVPSVDRWTPYRESFIFTLVRTVTIAAVLGAVLASLNGGWSRWPVATLLSLWPSFGGHWVEILFLNHLRPRLPVARPAQVAARFFVWFVGGVALGSGMWLTVTMADFPHGRLPPWWIAGLAFVGIELVVHMFLWVLRRPSFYDGRG